MSGSLETQGAASRVVQALSDVELLLRIRIEAFMAEYVHAIDQDLLETWSGFFTNDATYRVTTRENYDQGMPLSLILCKGGGMLRDRISALRTANIYEPHVYCHVIGGFRLLETAPDSARTESLFQVIRTMSNGAMSIFACGRAIDQFTITDGQIKLAERTIILDSRQIDTLLAIPL